MGKLAHLESLLLRSNHFGAVPLELCKLPHLRCRASLRCSAIDRTLDLRDNGFTSLPSCDLPKLTPLGWHEARDGARSLDVSGNALSSLPPWVVRSDLRPVRVAFMAACRSLLADGNQLSALPESWHLPNVESGSQSSWVICLAKQPNLARLSIFSSSFHFHRTVFFGLLSVVLGVDRPRVVSLRKNRLTALPKSFPESHSLRPLLCQLSHAFDMTRELYLAENKLISLPSMQGVALGLETLACEDCAWSLLALKSHLRVT